MKIEVDETRDILLSEVYNPVVIKDDTHKYGIAQRDGGLEIVCDGEMIAILKHGKCTVPVSPVAKTNQLAHGKLRYEICRWIDTRTPEGFCQVYKSLMSHPYAYVYEKCAACTSFEAVEELTKGGEIDE